MPKPRSDALTRQRAVALGTAIQRRRLEAGISQETVGHAIGLRQRDISRIALGEHTIGTDRLWQVAVALNMKPSQLLADAENQLDSL